MSLKAICPFGLWHAAPLQLQLPLLALYKCYSYTFYLFNRLIACTWCSLVSGGRIWRSSVSVRTRFASCHPASANWPICWRSMHLITISNICLKVIADVVADLNVVSVLLMLWALWNNLAWVAAVCCFFLLLSELHNKSGIDFRIWKSRKYWYHRWIVYPLSTLAYNMGLGLCHCAYIVLLYAACRSNLVVAH